MNGQQLIERVRMKTQDLSSTKFWSDEEILFNINEAMKEAAVRHELIYDRSSTITVIPSVIGQVVYEYDPLFFLIKKVRFDGRMLDEIAVERLDRFEPDGYLQGYVSHWYIDKS